MSQLLRIATAGSVDDGKSTLIGRLLYDSKAIFEDQYAALEKTSTARGSDAPDLALLTDGLRAEREQGITIDVAYRYFATPKRKFIIADTPGHIQYTRNMVTGASTADLALILVDARNGIVEQSRRHTFLASLLSLGTQGAAFGISNYLTSFLSVERGMTVSMAGVCVLFNSVGGFFGFLVNAYISDNVGRRGAFRLFGAGFILTAGQVLSGAREEASILGTPPISLYDGLAVARLCEENDVAVLRARLPIAIPDVDLLEALRAS